MIATESQRFEMNAQLELFQRDPSEHLFPYWRKRLLAWPREVLIYRHYRNTTGWSMACQDFMFAGLLLRHGQLSRPEYRRWWRFERRVKRWDASGGRQ
jgi:hypothetical protein